MTWIYLGASALLVFLLVRMLVKRPGAGISAYDFEHWFHSFAKIKKEGAAMTLSHSSSPFLRVRRGPDRGTGTVLFVDVPRTSWSERHQDELSRWIEQKMINAYEPADDPGVMLRVDVEVPDLWDVTSGAKGARVAQEMFEALGLDSTARFDVAMKGSNSLKIWKPVAQRWAAEENPVLRAAGRSMEREVEREAASQRSGPKSDQEN